MAKTLHLIVPQLLGAWERGLALPPITAPALAWLLARSDRTPVPAATDALLLQLFSVAIPPDADLPTAPIMALAHGIDSRQGWWLRADPVHLRADMRGVFLVDARALAIEGVEAALLAATFDNTFAEDGLQLFPAEPDCWYLQLPADPELRTHPLLDTIGRDINPLLPHGSNARRWHTLLTEAQMLFHAHSVNRSRDQHNQPLINGLWLWGGGILPPHAQAPAERVYADDPLTCGLARLSKNLPNTVPENAAAWQDLTRRATDSLIVLDMARYDRVDNDPVAWAEHVQTLEEQWFAPLQRSLQRGELAALYLYGGDGYRHALKPNARWHFWRRTRPLHAVCSDAP